MSTSIIAIVNQKGGTGKTTTSVNLGSALSKKNKKVLIIDLDPQGNLGYSLGLTEFQQTMADVLMGEAALQDILITAEGMDVAPSDVNMADIELSLAQAESREYVLKSALGSLTKYDFVILDCPPSLSLLTINALITADKVIIPMQMEVLSLQGLDQIIETINGIKSAFESNVEIMGILPVMFDSRRKLSSEIHEHILENYAYKIFDSKIRTNVRASEAPSFGKSVVDYAPKSSSSQDYLAFAKEVIKLNK